MELFPTGYEDAVRIKLGVYEDTISNDEINNPFIKGVAETVLKKRIPDIDSIIDEHDVLMVQNALLSYICYLLVPSLRMKFNIEVSSIDMRFRKDKIDWESFEQKFLSDYEASLDEISTVDVYTQDAIVGLIRNVRYPIGS